MTTAKAASLLLVLLFVTGALSKSVKFADELVRAVETNDPLAVNATLKKGADANLVHGGESVLMRAIEFGNFDAAQSLLQHKAALNVKAKNGLDPLHTAAKKGEVSITQLILQYWGDNHIHHKIEGLSAFHRACQGTTRYHAHTAEMMLAHGASPVAKTDGGHTPYDLAHHAGNKKTATVLLQYIQRRYPSGYDNDLHQEL